VIVEAPAVVRLHEQERSLPRILAKEVGKNASERHRIGAAHPPIPDFLYRIPLAFIAQRRLLENTSSMFGDEQSAHCRRQSGKRKPDDKAHDRIDRIAHDP
jgi:hypothetical protein